MFKSRSDETNVTHCHTDVKKARFSAAMAYLSVSVSRVDVIFLSSESAAAVVGGSKMLKARLCAPALL